MLVPSAMRLLASLLAIALPSLAAAGPITAGASVGLAQSEVDKNADASHTLGLFGRLAFGAHIAGQLELARYATPEDANTTIRIATAALVVDLVDHGPWVPTLIVGAGIDHADDDFGSLQRGHHIEGGFGLEYRSTGGFTIGADARLGSRTLDEQVVPLTDVAALWAPRLLSEGEYRSMRVTLGVRF